MTGLPWFRMYAEFGTDPVVQTLDFGDQRHFVMLLCFKCSGLLDREFPNPDTRTNVIRKTLGLDGKAWDEMQERLMDVGLIDSDLQPCAWDERQFLSDSTNAKRQRRYRERHRNVTSNVTVTVQDTDSDISLPDGKDIKKRARKAKPAPIPERALPVCIDRQAWDDYVQNRVDLKSPITERGATLTLNKLTKHHAQGDDVNAALIESTMNGWKGVFPKPPTNGAKHGNPIPENRRERDERLVREELAAIDQRIRGATH